MKPLALAVALTTVGAHAATSSPYLTVSCAPAKGINLAAKAGNPAGSPVANSVLAAVARRDSSRSVFRGHCVTTGDGL